MKICIFGAGGLGALFGGLMADDGADVSFIARGSNLAAMRENGLKISSPLGDRFIELPAVFEKPEDVGPVDVLLMCVKRYDLEVAAKSCLPLIAADTAVIPVLNGVEARDVLGGILGVDKVSPGVTYVPSNLDAPGVVVHKAAFCDLTVGALEGKSGRNIGDFCEAAESAGIQARISDDIDVNVWSKFIAWSASSGVTSVSRQPIGTAQRVPELKALFRGLMEEAEAVARARGVRLPSDCVDQAMTVFEGFPPTAKSSTLVDLEAGRRLEIDLGVGAIMRMSDELGLDAPLARTVYAALVPHRDGQAENQTGM